MDQYYSNMHHAPVCAPMCRLLPVCSANAVTLPNATYTENWAYPVTPSKSTPQSTSAVPQGSWLGQQGLPWTQQLAMRTGQACQQPTTATVRNTADGQPPVGVDTTYPPCRTIWHWRCGGRLKQLLGHAYMGTLGALIYAEVSVSVTELVATQHSIYNQDGWHI